MCRCALCSMCDALLLDMYSSLDMLFQFLTFTDTRKAYILTTPPKTVLLTLSLATSTCPKAYNVSIMALPVMA